MEFGKLKSAMLRRFWAFVLSREADREYQPKSTYRRSFFGISSDYFQAVMRPTSLTAFGDKKAKVILVMTFASVLSIQLYASHPNTAHLRRKMRRQPSSPRLPTASIAKVEGSGTTVRTALSNQADPPPYSSSSTFTCVVPTGATALSLKF